MYSQRKNGVYPEHRRLALGNRFESTRDTLCARVDHGVHLQRESPFDGGHRGHAYV